MTIVTLIFSLMIEVLRLINRSGGTKQALATLQQVNSAFDQLKSAQSPKDKQNAAEGISKLISGDPS